MGPVLRQGFLTGRSRQRSARELGERSARVPGQAIGRGPGLERLEPGVGHVERADDGGKQSWIGRAITSRRLQAGLRGVQKAGEGREIKEGGRALQRMKGPEQTIQGFTVLGVAVKRGEIGRAPFEELAPLHEELVQQFVASDHASGL